MVACRWVVSLVVVLGGILLSMWLVDTVFWYMTTAKWQMHGVMFLGAIVIPLATVIIACKVSPLGKED